MIFYFINNYKQSYFVLNFYQKYIILTIFNDHIDIFLKKLYDLIIKLINYYDPTERWSRAKQFISGLELNCKFYNYSRKIGKIYLYMPSLERV